MRNSRRTEIDTAARSVWLAIVFAIAAGVLLATALVIVFFTMLATFALARDGGQWEDNSVEVRQWFRSLMQPDHPNMSCCGEADAYDADNFEVDGDQYVAIITDGHGVIPNGTRITVPNHKMKWDYGNPTGHGIVFLSTPTTITDAPAAGYWYVLRDGNQARVLYCYVTGAAG